MLGGQQQKNGQTEEEKEGVNYALLKGRFENTLF